MRETSIGHLLGEGMFEGVFDVGKETRFVEELRRLQVRQATVERHAYGPFAHVESCGRFPNGYPIERDRSHHALLPVREALQMLIKLAARGLPVLCLA